ncbi:MAG: hypothetical protein O3C28_20295 [Proteobacteria bacterium]|nr:hypothetical protein [Pseudomonadota bacterium]
MSTRRGFLISSAAVLAGPTHLHAQLLGKKTRIVIDSNSPEGNLFSEYLLAPTTVIDLDPLNVLTALNDEFAKHDIDTVYGLTRGSNRFLIEQFARPNGYRMIHTGEHEFGNGQIAHTLTSTPSHVDDFAEHIVRSRANWPVEVARLLESRTSHQDAPIRNNRVVGLPISAGRVGQLCSWTLEKV